MKDRDFLRAERQNRQGSMIGIEKVLAARKSGKG